jgi:hypothetical protein
MWGDGGVAGSQPMSTAVYRSPNKLWRFTQASGLVFKDDVNVFFLNIGYLLYSYKQRRNPFVIFALNNL